MMFDRSFDIQNHAQDLLRFGERHNLPDAPDLRDALAPLQRLEKVLASPAYVQPLLKALENGTDEEVRDALIAWKVFENRAIPAGIRGTVAQKFAPTVKALTRQVADQYMAELTSRWDKLHNDWVNACSKYPDGSTAESLLSATKAERDAYIASQALVGQLRDLAGAIQECSTFGPSLDADLADELAHFAA